MRTSRAKARPPRLHIPVPGEDAQCEVCGLVYDLNEVGEPATQSLDATCDDCGGSVEVVTEWPGSESG